VVTRRSIWLGAFGALFLAAPAEGQESATSRPESAQSRPWLTPARRLGSSPGRLEMIVGSQSFGVYVGGRKLGYEALTVERSSGSEGQRFVVTRDTSRCNDGSRSVRTFEGEPPFRLRSVALGELPIGKIDQSFVQGPEGSRLTLEGLGAIGHELSKSFNHVVVDQVLADAVPDRWLVSRTPREGDVLEFRPFDGDVGELIFGEIMREEPSGKGEAVLEGTVRPEPRKALISAVDRSSGLVRYRLELERDGGSDHCEVDEQGRMSRLTRRVDGQLEEWFAEPKDAATLPFDPSGRYRAGFSFPSPADGPNLVEALSIWLPKVLLPLVDRKTLNVSGSGHGAVITLPPGDRALTDDDRTGWSSAMGPLPPSTIQAWATEVAGAVVTTRERLGRLRDAVEAIPELDPWSRAQRLAEGARSIGIACRIVEGHAITDRSGTFMAPHAWVEAIDGDRVVAVDPASVRIPAPPTRLPMRHPDPAERASLTECCLEIRVASMTLRDVGIPDLKRGSSAWRRSPNSKDTLARAVIGAAPDLVIQKPDEIDVPEKVAKGTEDLYRMLPADAEILRHLVARDRWDAPAVASLRDVAERLSRFPDPPAMDLSSTSVEGRRATALAMGRWMAAQVRRREVYVLLMPSLVKLGPYIGLAAPTDVVLEQATESQKLAGLDVTLGVASIGGAKQAVVQAKREGIPVWARVICSTGRFPIGRPRWAPNPSADLGGLGFRLHVRAATGAHVYLGPDGSFQFYVINPFR
jgi:hypothetical protein